jgi:chaperonin cofactor prefoldin
MTVIENLVKQVEMLNLQLQQLREDLRARDRELEAMRRAMAGGAPSHS